MLTIRCTDNRQQPAIDLAISVMARLGIQSDDVPRTTIRMAPSRTRTATDMPLANDSMTLRQSTQLLWSKEFGNREYT